MTVPNSDTRKNQTQPPPKEPIRNALYYAAAVIAVVLTGLIVGNVITLTQLTLIGSTAGAVFALVFGLMERVRLLVNSPATSAANADIRDALAQAVVLAEQTGKVPPVGKTLAENVIAGGIRGVAMPALQAAALALGLPHAFVVAAAPAALQAAMDAVEHVAARAPTGDEAYQRVRDQAAAKQ